MTKFFQNHYEKIILAGLLLLFIALLYLQLNFIQQAQSKRVDEIINQPEPKPDFLSLAYDTMPRFSNDAIFGKDCVWLNDRDNDKNRNKDDKSDLMTPIPMAFCPYCLKLIPQFAFPKEKEKGKEVEIRICPLCKNVLKPRSEDAETVIVVAQSDDQNNNQIPDEWEKKYNVLGKADVDSDHDGFTNLEEFRGKTNPKDPKSHPRYLTRLVLVGEPKQKTMEELLPKGVSFQGVVTLRRLDVAKKVAYFDIKEGKKDRMLPFTVGEEITYRKKNAFDKVPPTLGFKLAEIVTPEKGAAYALIERMTDDKLQLKCFEKKRICTEFTTFSFENTALGATTDAKTGETITLGTKETGEEKYKVGETGKREGRPSVFVYGPDNKKTEIFQKQNAAVEPAPAGENAENTGATGTQTDPAPRKPSRRDTSGSPTQKWENSMEHPSNDAPPPGFKM